MNKKHFLIAVMLAVLVLGVWAAPYQQNTFTTNTPSAIGGVTLSGSGTITANGGFIGNGSGLTNLSATAIPGLSSNSYTPQTGGFYVATGPQAIGTTNNGSSLTNLTGTNIFTPGTENLALGVNALQVNTGFADTAVGYNGLLMEILGQDNTAIGALALQSHTNGSFETAIGALALNNDTNGSGNTAVGYVALGYVGNGSNNIAIGQYAGTNIFNGSSNIDIGASGTADESSVIRIGTSQKATYIAGNQLYTNASTPAAGQFATYSGSSGVNWTSSGQGLTNFNGTNISCSMNGNSGSSGNIALGFYCGNQTCTGIGNFIGGYEVGNGLTSGGYNVALGYDINITSGNNNVFLGNQAGSADNTGIGNVAIGKSAMLNVGGGNYNVDIGFQAVSGTSVANSYNVAIGASALYYCSTGSTNIAIGAAALAYLTTGTNNIGIGVNAGTNVTTGINNIYLGACGTNGNENSTIRLGMPGLQTNLFVASTVIWIATNAVTSAQTAPAGYAGLWNSNSVLYWITSTHTNYVSGP